MTNQSLNVQLTFSQLYSNAHSKNFLLQSTIKSSKTEHCTSNKSRNSSVKSLLIKTEICRQFSELLRSTEMTIKVLISLINEVKHFYK